ncbi:MAG: MiaB/RimO family radical SAM methylthiotransferase [Anaerolineaceae bacterium]
MKIFLDTIGCRLNQSEIEKLAAQFHHSGHEIVSEAGDADLVVVNTCAVTAVAASDSRQKIRQAQKAGAGMIVATGCWATLESGSALALPGVGRVVRNEEKSRLVSLILDLPEDLFDLEPLLRERLPGTRQRTRAFIKVQDGCDNFCSFCVTRLARGASRSTPLENILNDIHAALETGTREIVLSGVHMGAWGRDIPGEFDLAYLIRRILEETPVERLRLSSLEPWDLDQSFFSLWQDRRLCRHLHLPLQSGSANTLRRMVRKTTPESFAGLVAMIRAVVPEMAITTDIITGFPGESAVEFQESLDFVRRMDFAGGHVFNYSSRPQTSAAKLSQTTSIQERKRRSVEMRAVLQESARRYRQSFINKNLSVLWEGHWSKVGDRYRLEGLSDNYLRVSALAVENRWNRIDKVMIDQDEAGGLAGTIVKKLME